MEKRMEEIPQSWGMYLQGIDEKPAMTRTNLALFDLAPIESYCTRIQFAVYYMDASESGLPSAEENPKLWEIEDALNEAIQGLDVIDVGLMKWDGRINFFLYAKETEEGLEQIERVLVRTMNDRFESYRWRIWFDEDEDWDCYFETLYPNKYSMQEIENNKVLQALQSEGDDLSQERLIEHWAYFQSEGARDAFMIKVQTEQFEPFTNQVFKEGDYRYQVGVARSDCPDEIHKLTCFLLDAAEEFGGFYDGWGCGIVK